MIAAVQRQDWKVAADEMEDSLWIKQVGNRGWELAYMMRSAKMPFSTKILQFNMDKFKEDNERDKMLRKIFKEAAEQKRKLS